MASRSDSQESRPSRSVRSTQDTHDEAAPSSPEEAPLAPTKDTYDSVSISSNDDLECGLLEDVPEQRRPRSSLEALSTLAANSGIYLISLALLRYTANLPFLVKSAILDHNAPLTLTSRAIFESTSLLTWIIFTYFSYVMPKLDFEDGKRTTFRKAMVETLCMLFFLWAAINFVTIQVCQGSLLLWLGQRMVRG